MNEVKPWYASRAVWGGLVAVAAGLARLWGFELSGADASTLADAGCAVAGLAGGVLAVFGRVLASRAIATSGSGQ